MGNSKLLIKKLSDNDPEAEKEIYKKFNTRLFTYFKFRIKGEDNYEDLVQEVFVSFFDAVRKNKIKEDFYIAPYIFGIAKRLIYNYFYKKNKKENIKKKAEAESKHFYDFTEEKKIDEENILKTVNRLIEELKEIDKIILKNYFNLEKNLDEISELTGKSKHYISVRKERALKKLKSEIYNIKDLFN